MMMMVYFREKHNYFSIISMTNLQKDKRYIKIKSKCTDPILINYQMMINKRQNNKINKSNNNNRICAETNHWMKVT